jgi:2-iminobutanoate/2-iminopropanoate deaminase
MSTSPERRIVHTDKAPAAIGPYSQAVVHAGVVYTAGQIALDPATGQMVGGGDVRLETEQVMKNLAAVLEAAGSGLAHALRCELYLASLEDYAIVNEVYASAFDDATAPARVAIEAARLPRDARIEIACTAAVV